MKKKIKVFVCGPYTLGDVAMNVRAAIEAADRLALMGFVPFIPHLAHFWHLVSPYSYTFWMDWDKEFLIICDALLRIPGESGGAEKEIEVAKSLGIPVFYDIKYLQEYFIAEENAWDSLLLKEKTKKEKKS